MLEDEKHVNKSCFGSCDLNWHVSYTLTSKGIFFFSEFAKSAFITRDDFRLMLMGSREKLKKVMTIYESIVSVKIL